jgi:CheY-like chemotaxis protein
MIEQSPAHILIVDDEPNISRLVAQILENQGYLCETCENGAKAVEKIASGNFTLVVSDINMPVMSGIELLTRVKRSTTTGPLSAPWSWAPSVSSSNRSKPMNSLSTSAIRCGAANSNWNATNTKNGSNARCGSEPLKFAPRRSRSSCAW